MTINHHLHDAGKKLLRAMSKHVDLIMEAYLRGSISETNDNSKVIETLIGSGILWRPEVNADLRLRRVVRALLEEGLCDERSRRIDANVGSALASLTTTTAHVKEALAKQRHTEAEAWLDDLAEQVYSLKETLKYSVRVLWERIHKEFGYVRSIEAKIRENELAQTQVSDMLEQLELFDFDKLGELAGSQRELRQLLVITLQSTFTEVAKELSLVQGRLIALLGRFREFQGRTRLLKGFLLHMEHKPDYRPATYPQHSLVPKLFNQAPSVIKPAAIVIDNAEHEATLQEMVSRIKARHFQPALSSPLRGSSEITLENPETIAIEENQLKAAVESYFCHVIDSGEQQSALEYYQHHQLSFDPEVWLYQVIGGYQALPEQERDYFALETHDAPHPEFNGNRIIEDVGLWLR
jgi:hypothetical protein